MELVEGVTTTGAAAELEGWWASAAAFDSLVESTGAGMIVVLVLGAS